MARYKKTAKSYSAKRQNYKGKTAKAKKYAAKKYVSKKKGITARFATKTMVETKTLDAEFTGVYAMGVYTPDTAPLQQIPFNTGGGTQCVNLAQQGVNISQRVGNKIMMKNLQLRFQFNITGKQCSTQQFGRIVVLYDRQPPSSAYLPINNIFADSLQGLTVANGNPVSSMLNPSLFDRMVVLSDDMFPLQPTITTNFTATNNISYTGKDALCYQKFIKLKGLETTFSGTAGPMTLAQIETGALYVLAWGTATINTNDGWQVYGNARLRYIDV